MFGENWRDSFEYFRHEGFRGAALNQAATAAARLCGRYGWIYTQACEYVIARQQEQQA